MACWIPTKPCQHICPWPPGKVVKGGFFKCSSMFSNIEIFNGVSMSFRLCVANLRTCRARS